MRLGRIYGPDGICFVSIEGNGENAVCKEIAEHPFSRIRFTKKNWKLLEVKLLAPVLASKVICISNNYEAHSLEMSKNISKEPIIFLKPNTSIIGPNMPIKLPHDALNVQHEGELAIVIGQLCKNVSSELAIQSILGYTIANDLSARDQQNKDGQWTRAKSHDTFCPVGPWILTELDTSDLEIRTEVNNEVRQLSWTSMALHNIGSIIEWVSKIVTLLPGDLILTGTPGGVGSIEDGDTVSININTIGTLQNAVIREK